MKWLLILALLVSCDCQARTAEVIQRCVQDDVGHRIILNTPAKRIISLAPDITESLFAIGAGSSIVGVIQGSNYPAAALTIPTVGSYSGLDLERIILLKPDLVVVWGSGFSRQMAVLAARHIPIYEANPSQLDDVPRAMRKLGCLTGNEKTANEQANQFSTSLSQLKKRYKSAKSVSVFYQLGNYSLMTINHQSWINQVITLCGGRNVFANAITVAPEVSWESVIAANPEVVINDSGSTAWQTPWLKWTSLNAVAHHQLYQIHSDWIDRAGPRLINGAMEMCDFLQKARAA